MSTFEIVRTDAGWHTRFRATNGRIVWTTEVYTRKRAAYAAVDTLIGLFGGIVELGTSYSIHEGYDRPVARVVELDERTN